MPPLINMFWLGERVPMLHRMCMASFVRQGHPVDLYCYEPLDVPEGVSLKDASKVLDRRLIFTTESGSYALFADQFRYELLHRIGGWWSDCDVYCLRPFDFDAPYVFGLEARGRINNAVIRVPPQCDLTRRLVEDGRRLRVHRHWARGARVFHNAVMDLKLAHWAVPEHVFYPVPATQWDTLFERGQTLAAPDAPDTPGDAYALHLWGEMIRKHRPALLDGPFDQDSPVGALWRQTFEDRK